MSSSRRNFLFGLGILPLAVKAVASALTEEPDKKIEWKQIPELDPYRFPLRSEMQRRDETITEIQWRVERLNALYKKHHGRSLIDE